MRPYSRLRLGPRPADLAWRLLGLLVWLTLPGFCGCGPGSADPPTAGSTLPKTQPEAAQASPEPAVAPKHEAWYVASINGARVGYERTTTTDVTRDGRRLVRIDDFSHMVIKRFAEPTEIDAQFTSIETPQGELIEFQGKFSQGPVPLEMTGRVIGDELRLETTTMGKKLTTSIPWSADYGGFRATEQSLQRKPLKPGDQRTIRALIPGFNVVGTSQLIARDFEPVELLAGTYDLLRIDATTTLPDGQTLNGSLWTDRTGEVLKHRLEAMNIESFRATRAQALEETEPAQLDLGLDVAIPVRPLPSPHATRRVRYRIKLEDGDPGGVFVSGPSQRVKSVDPHTAELTVYALRPAGRPGNPDAPDDPPTDDDRQPNNLIQSDYPAIVAKAAEVAGRQKDPWQVALALEQAVHRIIRNPGFSQAFATAAEVIDSGQGDCTEHAVLLAALARARGIPARAAIGLVYKDRAFYYHMWTEVYVASRWIALDGTLGRGGIGAAHLKMAHSSLKGASAWTSLLPVLQVIGRLQIDILEIEH